MEAFRERDVVVIGGGISGLACAWWLHRAGLDVMCVEASQRAGGALCSHRIDGFLVEAGASTVLQTPELAELVNDVGLGPEVVRAPALPRYVVRDGSLHAAPSGVGSLLGTRLLSGRAKWRLVRELFVPPRAGSDDESVDEFVRRRFGAEVARMIAAPFVAGTFAGDPAALSARAVLPRLVALEERHGGVIQGMLRAGRPRGAVRASLISLRDGMESLPRRTAERIGDDLWLGAETEAIHRTGHAGRSAWTVSVRRGAQRVRISTRAVVLATACHAAAALLGEVAPTASQALGEIPSASLAVVSLAWPRASVTHSLRGLGFLVAPGERIRILGCLWPSSAFPNRAPASHAAFTAFVGGTLDAQAVCLEDEALVDLVRHDLAQLLGITGDPRVLSVDCHHRALPQYGIGHGARIARVRQAVESVSGLFVCGNYFSGVSVGETARMAQATAAAVVGSLH